MAKVRYYQLVEFFTPFPHYRIHEAVMDTNLLVPDWVGSYTIATYNTYHEAVMEWGKKEKKWSGLVDIIDENEYNELVDETDKEKEEELELD